jgi:hypothetical protein
VLIDRIVGGEADVPARSAVAARLVLMLDHERTLWARFWRGLVGRAGALPGGQDALTRAERTVGRGE